MEREFSDRRREPRFPIAAGACVEVKGQGGSVHAKTVDISGGGVLLRFEGDRTLNEGDQVTCAFRLPQEHGEPLPFWGVGNVVRVKGDLVAVELMAGGFTPLTEQVVGQDCGCNV